MRRLLILVGLLLAVEVQALPAHYVPFKMPLFQVSVIGNTFSGGTVPSATTFSSNVTFSGMILAADGTVAAPSIAFTSTTNSGLKQNGAGGVTALVSLGAAQAAYFTNLWRQASGLVFCWASTSDPIGTTCDTSLARGGTNGALRIFGGTNPTISSGFGTSPAMTAGGSNSLFEVNVGTGGTATSGVIAFNGTWTNAPYCFVNDEGTSAGKSKAVATPTQVTLTTTTAWTASSLLDVFCVSQ